MKKLLFLGVMLLITSFIFSQDKNDLEMMLKASNISELERLTREAEIREKENQERLAKFTQQLKLKSTIIDADGRESILVGMTKDLRPIYYVTHNLTGAKNSRTNYLNSGGGLGLNLNGQGMTAYMWEINHPNLNHQEFSGRVSIGDNSDRTSGDHPTHVMGSILAAGIDPQAKGMAPQARGIFYDISREEIEAASVANQMLISNHSYGMNFIFVLPWEIGAYVERARVWDEIMYNAPYYLMVTSAGNDAYASNPNPIENGYDKLTSFTVAKNNLVVANAKNVTIDNSGNLVTAAINSDSSPGPTDDLRIKPDISAYGANVYSCFSSSPTSYGRMSGTSMASPNASGNLLLLQQHYKNLKGTFMKAATLKGLVLHTADDIAPTGPDARSGWGLLNAKRAAETITDNEKYSIIRELSLYEGNSYHLSVTANGPIIASISWTDPAGIVNTGVLNQSTPVLVNDLDIRITKNGTTYYPYKLTSASTNGKGDNTVDPFERIDIPDARGSYTISVTHKGTLTLNKAPQAYSLIITGVTKSVQPAPDLLKVYGITNNSAYVSWSKVYGSQGYYLQYRPIDSSTWMSQEVTTQDIRQIRNLLPNTTYEWRVWSDRSPTAIGDNFTTLPSTTKSSNNLNKEILNDVVVLYPNPVQDILYIKGLVSEEKESIEVVIFDSNGRRIVNKKMQVNDPMDIDVSNLSNGIFYLNILNHTYKFIKK